MYSLSRFVAILAFGVMLSIANAAAAEGLGLGESKEELKLDYDLAVTHHRTGRVTVKLVITDAGRLKPLTSVDLVVGNTDGTRSVDLSVSLALREADGKMTARAHLHRDLAERAKLRLTTNHLDGKQELMTWYYYSIPLAEHMTEKGRDRDSGETPAR